MFLNTRNTKFVLGCTKLLALVAAIALSTGSAHAQGNSQTGTVSGSVLDADYGGVVSATRIVLLNTEFAVNTDLDGRFTLTGVPVGTYTLVASASFYKSSLVEDLTVVAGDVARVNIPLYGDDSDVIELDSVTVKAAAIAGSDSLLQAQRQVAPGVSDLIGSEKFSKLALGDAADALGKVTGVSITDGKYMVVRGLSDRYNNTTMNGATVPSADPDKRAVQLDQFPTGIIDTITTVKTFTPDKAGNFTGGYVDIKTKSVPERLFLNVKFGFSHNSKTTGQDILLNSGGSDDWKGKDDGTRALPEIASRLDEVTESPRNLDDAQRNLLSDITKSFDRNMIGQRSDAPLNHSTSISFGNRFNLGGKADGMTLGVIGSLSNKQSFSFYDDGIVGRYELNPDGLVSDASFVEEKGEETNEWGSMLNVALRPNERHEIGINTSYTRSGTDESISREGSRQASGGALFRVQNLHYTQRSLSVAQLYGEHDFENLGGTRINWFISDSTSTQDEPDFRLFYDEIPSDGFPVFRGNFPAPRRYWRDLEETTADQKIDVAVPFGRKGSEIKVGIQNTETERAFTETAYSYRDNARGLPSEYRYDANIHEFLSDQILSLNPETGEVQRYITEALGAVPEYNGIQKVEAGYLMADFRPSERWRLIFGARHEETSVEVESYNNRGELNDDDGSIDESSWLPALNIVYELSERSNLRFAITETLARPNFRELSPFGSFDNIGGETFVGNPDLLMSDIRNIDLRWEFFPTDADVLAATIFQKEITNPIELNFINGELTYVNVESAEVSGIELEARKGFTPYGDNNMNISVGGNLSYVNSEVKRSDFEIAQKGAGGLEVSPTRELQGQSEIVGNMDLSFEHYAKGVNVSLAYTYTGERLYSVSLGSLPDVYEAPSGDLSLIWSQKLRDKLSMKLAFRNLLDDGRRKYLTFDGEEAVYSEYKKGLTTALSFSYDFY